MVKKEKMDLAKDEADEVRSMKSTPNFGKKTETTRERSEEGGASMLIQGDNTQSNADIKGKLATTKRSAERRSMSRPPQADDHGGMFVMRHRENSISASTSTSGSNPKDVWFVDSGALKHMVPHQGWL